MTTNKVVENIEISPGRGEILQKTVNQISKQFNMMEPANKAFVKK